jgi:Animal haem peroxidase
MVIGARRSLKPQTHGHDSRVAPSTLMGAVRTGLREKLNQSPACRNGNWKMATDVYTVSVLRNLLFAPLVGGDVDEVDLIAIDIQRERDVGLATLNQTRKALGLAPYSSFAQLTSDPVLQKNLATVYGNIANVDLFMGGLAEDHVPGASVGPTFQAIIATQFQSLRAGDRFFWRNENFDRETTDMISDTTLAAYPDACQGKQASGPRRQSRA